MKPDIAFDTLTREAVLVCPKRGVRRARGIRADAYLSPPSWTARARRGSSAGPGSVPSDRSAYGVIKATPTPSGRPTTRTRPGARGTATPASWSAATRATTCSPATRRSPRIPSCANCTTSTAPAVAETATPTRPCV